MRKGHEIGRYMPLEADRWRTSDTVRWKMKDFQRSWFIQLLLEGWVNAEMPCHVPNNENTLWSTAGAHSKLYFDKHQAVVMREFRACGQGIWICNVNSLEIFLDKLGRYLKKKPPDFQTGSKRECNDLFLFLNSCTCLSEKDKAKYLAVSPEDDSRRTPSLFSRVEMEAAVGKAPRSMAPKAEECLCYRKQSGEWVICPLCEERKAAQA